MNFLLLSQKLDNVGKYTEADVFLMKHAAKIEKVDIPEYQTIRVKRRGADPEDIPFNASYDNEDSGSYTSIPGGTRGNISFEEKKRFNELSRQLYDIIQQPNWQKNPDYLNMVGQIRTEMNPILKKMGYPLIQAPLDGFPAALLHELGHHYQSTSSNYDDPSFKTKMQHSYVPSIHEQYRPERFPIELAEHRILTEVNAWQSAFNMDPQTIIKERKQVYKVLAGYIKSIKWVVDSLKTEIDIEKDNIFPEIKERYNQAVKSYSLWRHRIYGFLRKITKYATNVMKLDIPLDEFKPWFDDSYRRADSSEDIPPSDYEKQLGNAQKRDQYFNRKNLRQLQESR